jgi:hypothetical protein
VRVVSPTTAFTFANFPVIDTGTPRAICLHTDGNPAPHTALDALNWGDRTGSFSIHYYIDADGTVFDGVKDEQLAFHVKEYRMADSKGWPVTHPDVEGKRGDIGVIGIENLMDASGHWSQETRISLLLLVGNLVKQWPHLADAIVEHADLDPWQRADDVGDALHLGDFRDDLADLLSGEAVAWRTVGEEATGTRKLDADRPTLVIVPAASASWPTALSALEARVDELEATAITQAASLTRLREHLRES